MKKIVIISDQIKMDNTLIVLLNEIFPECEICITPGDMDYFNSHHSYFSSKFQVEDEERRMHHGKKS